MERHIEFNILQIPGRKSVSRKTSERDEARKRIPTRQKCPISCTELRNIVSICCQDATCSVVNNDYNPKLSYAFGVRCGLLSTGNFPAFRFLRHANLKLGATGGCRQLARMRAPCAGRDLRRKPGRKSANPLEGPREFSRKEQKYRELLPANR